MTRRNIEVNYIKSGTNYGPMPYGQFAGQPTVSLKLSSSDQNSIKVNSLENIFRSRNWKRKLNSGYARLRIYGSDPFSEENAEALDYLFDLLDPRFIDFEIEDKYIDKEPLRIIKQRIDTFSFFFDMTKDEVRYDPDVLADLIDGTRSSAANVQFICKVDSASQENGIRNFRNNYQVYDSDFWMYPKGTKPESVYESREKVVNFAKRNKWNVSPRMDVEFDNGTEDE